MTDKHPDPSSNDGKPEPDAAADRVSSDDPMKTQKLAQAGDDIDPNEGQN